MTIRNTGGRSGGGLVAAGTLGGIAKGAGMAGSYIKEKEEARRRKPFEDMQLRSLTASTEASEAKLQSEGEQRARTKLTQSGIAELIKNNYNFDDEVSNEIAKQIDEAPTKNSIIVDAVEDSDMIEKVQTPEGGMQVLEELGVFDDSDRGREIREKMPERNRLLVEDMIQKRLADVEPTEPAEEPAPGDVLEPGQPAKSTTTAYRPGDTGELEKVELDEEPIEIRQKRALLSKYDELQARDNPEFTNTIAALEKGISDYEAGKAATAKAGEAERVRLEEFGLKERKLESDVEQKGLDRDAKAEQARLKREFDREDTAIKNQYAKDLADAKAKDPALKKVSVPIIKGITETGAALVRFKQLRKLLDENKVGVFERAFKFGSFTNPEVESAMSYLKNRLGRKDSGAAISATEWKVFEKLILDTKNLTSDKGRKVALAKIDQHIEDFGIFGTSLSGGDEDWFGKYQKSADTAREKVVGEGDEDAELADLKAQLLALEEEEE